MLWGRCWALDQPYMIAEDDFSDYSRAQYGISEMVGGILT